MTKHIKAFDPDQHQGPMPSPCINVCRMDEGSGLCIGCWRTLDEIIQWSRSDDAAKRQVWQTIKQRVAENANKT